MTVKWSYSSLSEFEQCPRRYHEIKVLKRVKDFMPDYRLHGNDLHHAIDKAVSGVQALPAKYDVYQPLVQRVQATHGEKLVEFKFAVTNSFRPTTYYADDVWCRGIIDFAVVRQKTAIVLDWKTGKVRPDPSQLKLFAAALSAHKPHVERFDVGFVYLAHNHIAKGGYTRAQVSEIWQEFLQRVRRLEIATSKNDFPPRPSGLCKAHCPVTKKHCEFSGRD